MTDRWAGLVAGARRWRPPITRTVVVVPRRGDDVLMFGALIALQVRRGCEVTVLSATDVGVTLDTSASTSTSTGPAEHLAALRHLGVDVDHVVSLGLPDGDVAAHADVLRETIARHAGAGSLLVAPWKDEVDPDHEACGRAAEAAAPIGLARCMYGIFWTYHRGDPDQLTDTDACAIDVDADLDRRRRRALAELCGPSAGSGDLGLVGERLMAPAQWTREIYLPDLRTA